MRLISGQVEESIIQNYILGHSRDEIAVETGVAPGSVSNKVNEWKRKIEAPDIEELRRFAVNIRKSEMTIKQCIKGVRFLQLLKGLEIAIENDDIDSDLDGLTFFVNEIYKNVKRQELLLLLLLPGYMTYLISRLRIMDTCMNVVKIMPKGYQIKINPMKTEL